MGGTLTRLRHLVFRIPEMRILMQGLDSAGKTTILYKLKLGEVVTTIPTLGFNVESVELNNASLQVWDCGGRGKVRPLWKFYMANTDALIWVVDSTDCERIDSDGSEYDFSSSRVELHKGLLEDELRDAVVLVFATKQDVAGAMTPAEVSERLGLPLIKSHQWHVQGCCGTTAEGLYEGLQWMTEAVKRQVKTKPKVVRPAEAAAASSVPLSGPPPQKPVVTRLKPPPVSQRRKLDAISSDNPDVLAVKGDDDPLAPASVSPSVPATVPTAPSLTTA